MRAGGEALGLRNRDLVIDPAMLGVPKPGVAVLGWNVDVRRTVRAFEVLQTPGIDFADGHGARLDS